jgi:hypothetical protein
MDVQGFDEQLRKILEGYANFLREWELALSRHQPYLVHWVRSFLLFARDHGGYTFEQTLDLFLAEVWELEGVEVPLPKVEGSLSFWPNP